ncbi:MAG: VOC family protein [Anaerolineaceae bacterium]|nr:VOC family protein [Anaerolineaceae bacterium]
MELKGISWLGTRTKNIEEMVKFCTEKLGLKPVILVPEMAVFVLPNGDVFEIMAPEIRQRQPELEGLECPKAEFLVDDVKTARADMEKLGVEFVGPVHTSEKHAWTNFRAPDGHLYGLTDDQPLPIKKK